MKKRKVAEGRVYVEKQERKKERLTEIKVSVFFNFLPLLKLSLTVFTFEIQNRTNTRMYQRNPELHIRTGIHTGEV
jgi:hypothetical protein